MYWLRYLLKGPYHALRTAPGREFMKLLWRYGDKPRFQPQQVGFGKYRLRVPDPLSFLFQYEEIFVNEYYHFETHRSRPSILDCGANVGMSVLYFKERYPSAQITAFEPEPAIAAQLSENLRANGAEDVTVVQKAVWIDGKGVEMSSEPADSSSIYATAAHKRKVPSVRLRDVLDGEQHVDFLKIDIEGAETEVLADCDGALGNVQHLFVEFHAYIGHSQSLSRVLSIFESNGFRYFIDTNQHRQRPFVNHRYRDNDVMDLQLNLFGWRE